MGADPLPHAVAPPDEREADVPGCSMLREAIANYARRTTSRARGRAGDAVAGLTVAVGSVPDGLAQAALIGINPVHGLYACIVAPLVGAMLSRTALMVVTTTSAAALVAAQALADVPGDERAGALFLMVVLAGLVMLLAGILRLGNLTQFVSFSVMAGFLAGIAVLLVLSQLPTALGVTVEGGSAAQRAWDMIMRPAGADWVSAMLTLLTIGVAVALGRTRIATASPLLGVMAATLIAVVFAVQVRTVSDVGNITVGLPMPQVPSLAHLPVVAGGAISIAAVVLVQGAGVTQSLPRGSEAGDAMSRDFVAQGAGNVVSGLLRGIPVGASLASSTLNVVAGATGRWAGAFAGVWMLLIVLFLSSLVALVPMPALAGLLILAGFRALRLADLRSVWRAGGVARISSITTFLSTLFLPLVAAVGIGVALAALLHLVRSAADVRIVELVERPDGRVEERAPADHLVSDRPIILEVYGDLFYAGARTLERHLPSPGLEPQVVILRLRGQTALGSTLMDVLADYGERLGARGGRLYLAGLRPRALRQLQRNGHFALTGPMRVYPATFVLGESTRRALADASAWLVDVSRAEDRASG